MPWKVLVLARDDFRWEPSWLQCIFYNPNVGIKNGQSFLGSTSLFAGDQFKSQVEVGCPVPYPLDYI